MPNSSPDQIADSVSKINDEVSVGEDLGFQNRWWRFERAAWILFVLLIVCDLAGLFGRGPLAKAEMSSRSQSFSVRYERIERTGTPSMLTITLRQSAFVDGVATVQVSDSVVADLGAQRVIPQPGNTLIGDGALTYTFPGRDPPAEVRIELQPVGPGIYPIAIGVRGEPMLRGKIWVMP